MCFRHNLINKHVFWNDKHNHVHTTFGVIEEVLETGYNARVRVREIKSTHVMDSYGNWKQEPDWNDKTNIFHIKNYNAVTRVDDFPFSRKFHA
jgi:hypothetical protein